MYVYMYVYMYLYVYIYIHIYIRVSGSNSLPTTTLAVLDPPNRGRGAIGGDLALGLHWCLCSGCPVQAVTTIAHIAPLLIFAFELFSWPLLRLTCPVGSSGIWLFALAAIKLASGLIAQFHFGGF